MKLLVYGLVALASSVVPAREDIYGDWHARQEGSSEQRQVVVPSGEAGEVAAEPTAEFTNNGGPVGSDPQREVERGESEAAQGEWESDGMSVSAPAAWEVACRIKSGSSLLFDRASVREYGAMTLFRWSAPRARTPGAGARIFTGVANCREKTIEAAWPGRSRETRAGTCGRGLVDAVCAAAAQASSPARGRQRSSSTRGDNSER